MSENFDELGELGDKIKKIIDTAVSTKRLPPDDRGY